MGNKKVIRDILEVIDKNRTFLISSHVRPDGDSIGSQLALASFLKRCGKSSYIAARDSVPYMYEFLPASGMIRAGKKTERFFDVAFILDCGDFSRTGDVIDIKKQARLVVNIDHHPSGSLFGNYNYVDPDASSVSEQVYNIITQSGRDLTKNEALCLYVGILTDTGRFQESNASARTHLVVSRLLDKGISSLEVAKKVYGSKRYGGVKLLASALDTLKLTKNGRVGYMVITLPMYGRTGSSEEDTEEIVNFARNVKGVEVGILFRQTPEGREYKVSLRSKGKADVNKVASVFSGGGHRNAAGCTVSGGFEAVKKRVLDAVSKEL